MLEIQFVCECLGKRCFSATIKSAYAYSAFLITLIDIHSIFTLNSSADRGDRSAGATSKTV